MLAVILFLLDALAVRVDVGVAGDTDQRAVQRLRGAKAAVQAGEDDVLEQNVGVGAGGRGELDHAVHRGGNLVQAQQTFLGGDAVQAARIKIALHLKPPFIGNRVAVENLILNYHTGAAAAEIAVCLYLRADLRQVAVHAARIDKYKMASASGFLKGFLCALRNLPRLFRKKGSVYVKK